MQIKDIHIKTQFKRVDDYQILQSLGKGAYGFVYKGLNTVTGSFVAIKQMLIGKSEMKSIKTQLNFLKKLQNPNIVKYIDAIQKQNKIYLILEYMEGGSLGSLVKKYVLDENVVKIYIKQILNGLVFLHKSGVIHRDIKGANILITKHGKVKLADFGVAIKIQQTKKTISAAGSPYWIAPEVIIRSQTTTKCDIWSLGCTIIELLTGNPPYFDLLQFPALFRIVQDEHPPLPQCGDQCRDFLLKCFSKQPQNRPQASQLLLHNWFKEISSESESNKWLLDSEIIPQIKQFLESKINYQGLYRLVDKLPQLSLLYTNELFFNLREKGEVISNIILYSRMVKHNFHSLKFLFGAGFIKHDFYLITTSPDSYFGKKDVEYITTLLHSIVVSAIQNQYVYAVIQEIVPIFYYFLNKTTDHHQTYAFISIIHLLFHNEQSINNKQLCSILFKEGLIEFIILPLIQTAQKQNLVFLRIQITLKIYQNWNNSAKYIMGSKVIKKFLQSLNQQTNFSIIFGIILILNIMVEEEYFQIEMEKHGIIFYLSQFIHNKKNYENKVIAIKVVQILEKILSQGHRIIQFHRHKGCFALKKWVQYFENDENFQNKIRSILKLSQQVQILKWK